MISTLVTTGVAVGGSAALGLMVEVPDDSRVARIAFKSYHRAAITSTCVSLSLAVFIGPVAGVISELIIYPACLLKVYKIKRKQPKVHKIPSMLVKDAKTFVQGKLSNKQLTSIFA